MTVLKEKHKKKLDVLLREVGNVGGSCRSSSVGAFETVFNVSGYPLNKIHLEVLKKGVKFAVSDNKVPMLDIIASTEVGIQNLTEDEKCDLRCKINTIISRPTKPKPNLTGLDFRALKELRENKEITIRKADKGGGIVIMDTSDYESKIGEILNSSEYIELNKNPTAQIERNVYKSLFKHKNYFQDKVRSRLTPHYSKPPHIYGLPKVHKENIPLRPVVSSRFGPVYELSKFLLPIISPLSDYKSSF